MSVKHTIKELDAGQLDLMWQFLQMGHQKANITALKENCDLLRQAMIQKNAGQRGDNRNYVSFDDLGTIINCIVIEAMCLYLSGKLDQIEEMSDLIDRQRALSICDSAIDLWTGQIGEGALIAVKNSIAKLPSVEPEIIRCKDCNNFKRNIPCVGGVCDGCNKLIDEGSEMPVDEDFYCGYAERRTE